MHLLECFASLGINTKSSLLSRSQILGLLKYTVIGFFIVKLFCTPKVNKNLLEYKFYNGNFSDEYFQRVCTYSGCSTCEQAVKSENIKVIE